MTRKLFNNNTTQASVKPESGVDEAWLNMDLLRFTTAGSVDDGKSTLIGRLLYDSKSIFEDQWEALETTTQSRGEERVNLALLTDGLRAEREQGITIDVAYRYFATPKRKFIIADTPGHEQYTRNMVTGASTADLAIILIDARKGVLTQSRRHAFLSSLLQIPHLVVAVNKMDLVGYREQRFDEIVRDFREFADNLDVDDITFIPMSALKGDNIVNSTDAMPWYQGPTLLHHLEHVNMGSRKNSEDFRFPVQYVIRPDQDFRGFAGRVVSGRIRAGEEVVILPSKEQTRITGVETTDGPGNAANTGESVVLQTADEIDISRGDMIVRKNNVPEIKTKFEATVSWMNKAALESGKPYVLMHTSRSSQAVIKNIRYRINVDTLHREETNRLELNEIGRVTIETSTPLFFDAYKLNNATGSFILIDPADNVTVGAGMIRSTSSSALDVPEEKSPDVTWEPWNIPRVEREQRNGHSAHVIWLTGASGAGKTTIAGELERRLWEQGKRTMLLDGDQVRHGLNRDLGFSPADRKENIRRVGEVARLFFEHGDVVICSFVSPYRADRDAVRELHPEGRFSEVYVHCAPETLQERDPKGLYRKAREGKMASLTGYDAGHEAPEGKHVISVDTDRLSAEQAVDHILKQTGII